MIDLREKLPVHPTLTYDTRDTKLIKYVVIHHTAGTADETPEQIAQYHVQKGWPGIGYHYLVGVDGDLYQVNDDTTVSYCVENGNHESLCICMIGDFTNDVPPMAQWMGAVELAKKKANQYGVIYSKIFGHREVPTIPPQATECPGKSVNMNSFRAFIIATDSSTWALWKAGGIIPKAVTPKEGE